MILFEAIKSWGLELLSGQLPTIFGWIYSSEKMIRLIDVSIGSEDEGIVVNCSELPDARVWLEITNLSPFKLELTGIEAILYWVGRSAEFKSMQRRTITPRSKEKVFIECSLNELQANHIKKNNQMNKPRLNVCVYLESSIRPLNKQREIQTSNFRLLNCDST